MDSLDEKIFGLKKELRSLLQTVLPEKHNLYRIIETNLGVIEEYQQPEHQFDILPRLSHKEGMNPHDSCLKVNIYTKKRELRGVPETLHGVRIFYEFFGEPTYHLRSRTRPF